ncbi:hypothetical protein HanPSC8_Chr09g0367431 [Helianthus annuus]|nr:hypothetical protein HanPSC8_Chr09g0367431 [Helianthus annuus]
MSSCPPFPFNVSVLQLWGGGDTCYLGMVKLRNELVFLVHMRFSCKRSCKL